MEILFPLSSPLCANKAVIRLQDDEHQHPAEHLTDPLLKIYIYVY